MELGVEEEEGAGRNATNAMTRWMNKGMTKSFSIQEHLAIPFHCWGLTELEAKNK